MSENGNRFSEDWWEKEKEKLQKKYGISFSNSEERLISREYLDYVEGGKTSEKNWYTSLCRFFRKVSIIKPDKETRIKLESAIKLLDWNIKPSECLTISIIFSLFIGIFAFAFFLTPYPIIFKLLVLSLPFLSLFYLLNYPHLKAMEKVLRSSEDLIFSVLYMIIYTYSSPNLEGAVLFAALNLKGPISEDFKKVLWDVEVGKYSSVEESLGDYISKWEPFNKDFLQAVQMVRASMLEASTERRLNFLNAASNTILNGTKEKMKNYSQDLKMPVTMLNGLGILLPILGMITLPMASIFLENAIRIEYIILFYNLIIPVSVYFFMSNILIKRPPTTSVKPLEGKNMPKPGRININLGGKIIEFPAIIFSILIFLLISGWSVYYYVDKGFQTLDASFATLIRSTLIVVGLAFSLAFYFYFGHKKRLNRQYEIKEIEDEFPVALFELGHRLIQGKPIEVSLDSAVRSMRNLRISDFFKAVSGNMKNIGTTFKDAIFNANYGALVRFPSKLIETVMKAILEASKKGTKIASQTMMTIATYLQNLHSTQESITDLMEETTTTMKFIGYVLAPVIAGVAVSMTQIMGSVLKILSDQFGNINNLGGGNEYFGSQNIFEGLINFSEIISPDVLQLIIGLYVVQILIIIGIFYARVREGLNKDYQNVLVGKLLFIGIIIYAITSLLIALLFGGIVESLTLVQ